MITSLKNPGVQRAKRLLRRASRSEQREFLIEGARLVREAIEAEAPLEVLFVDPSKGPDAENLARKAKSHSIRVEEVSPAVMKFISAATTAPGIVAVCRFVDRPAEDLAAAGLSLITILGRIRDPGNAGTILRTSRAAGADAVFFSDETVDIYNPKLVRASAGALFWMPVARAVELPWLLGELGAHGINRIAADPRGDCEYDHVDMLRPTAILVGNEAWGLPQGLMAQIDLRVSIPMAGSTESLNVAAAASVLLFEAGRQRRHAVVR